MRALVRIPSWLGLGLAVLASGAIPVQGQQVDPDFYDHLRWTSVGINRGGRSIGVAGSDARPYEYYFGATGGGLWKTTDGGLNWAPVTDGKINSASVGAVAVCEADPDVVWIGTGETQLRGNIQQGDGVYRSEDGGRTWEHMGLEETQNVSRIRVHPTDCNTVWVGGFGVHSMDNPERGVYKTTDGGDSWDLVLHESPRAGAADISVHPGNPDIVFASIWEAWRKSWGMSSGGPDSGLWRSTDGGETWEDITRNPGLPQEGLVGKIGVAVSPVNQDRVFAIIEHSEAGGVYMSEDGGDTWTHQNDERRLRQRAFYYTRIYADPQEEMKVFVLNTGMYSSTDGGETFDRQYRVPHGDNHDLWIAPSDNQRMINSNDGGGNVSVNGGDTWTDQEFPTAQFYRTITTAHEPYWICGAQQDNSTACMPSAGWNHLGARGAGDYFTAVGGCESGYIAPHPVNTDIFYAGCYGGSLSRYDHSTGLTRAVNVWPENPMGQSSEDLVERVQWTFPIVFSHQDPNTLYTGTQKVWRTTTEGDSWEQISPDLTRSDPSTIGPSGGPITRDQTGVETYATIFAIAPSYHDPNVIWVGSDDGYVHVTRNAQDSEPTWANVTPADAPDFVRINTIEASPHTPGKAYVAGIRYLVDDDRAPYVWVTEDYGQSWEKRVDGIPYGDFVRAVREDPVRAGLLYAATERTVFVSFDDGDNWQPLTQNLPTVQVADLIVEDHDIVLGTHGRSFWVMSDMDILRQLTPAVVASDFHLFEPKDPVRGFDNTLQLEYWLADDAQSATLEILDEGGNVIQTYAASSGDEEEEEEEPQGGFGRFGGGGSQAPSLRQGVNRFRWNMRTEGWTDFEGRIFWAAGNLGPAVIPGAYTVRLTVDGTSQEQQFEIKMNPRAVASGATRADLIARFEFAQELRDRVTEANEAVIRIRNIKGQVDDRMEASTNDELEAMGTEVNGKLTDVEGEIYQYRSQSNQDPLNFPIKLNNKLAALLNLVEGSENRPTEQSYDVYQKLSGELDVELGRLQIVINQDVQRLNDLLRELGMDPIDLERLIT
jgi:photosystem II stability/assembly factor-like uncharacterized protein